MPPDRTLRPPGGARIGIWGLLLAAVVACRREPPTTILDPASPQPLLRSVAAGELHGYRIALTAGQYLVLRVDQQGADLIVTFFDPGGRPLLEVDNPSGADGSRGPERVVWVAETGGDHGLTVRVREGWKPPGRYRLTVEELRGAGADDRRRAAAEAAIAAGDAFYGRPDRGSREQALDEYRRALATFEALGDRSRHADALYRIAKVRQHLDDRQGAIELYRRVAESYRQLGNRRQEAITLFQLCKLYGTVPDVWRARDACGRALPLWKQVEDRRGLALTTNELGFIHRRLGDGHLAITFYDQALALWRELGDRSAEALALHNRGRVYDSRGKRAQAVDDLLAALRIERQLGQPPAIVTTLNSLGLVHDRYGELSAARRFFQQALGVEDVTPRSRAISLTGLARIHARLGEARQALELFQQARETFRSQDVLRWEAVTLQGIGSLRAAGGELAAAEDSFGLALALRQRIRDRSGEAETLLAMAALERRRDDLDGALRRIETALQIIDDLRTRTSTVSTSRAYYRALQQDYFDFHVDLLMEQHLRDPAAGYGAAALAAAERARAGSLLQLLTESGADLERGVDPATLESKRDLERQIQARELQLVRWAERPDAVPVEQVEQVEREQRDLLREYEKLEEQIRASSPRYAALTQPRTLTAEEIRGQVVDRQTMLLEYKLGAERSFLWAVTPEAVRSFVLPGRDDVEGLARRVYDLIAANQRQSRRRLGKDLARLSAILLGPVADALPGTRRLLLVGEGVLQLLPFSALPMPGPSELDARPLVETYEIVSLPSASTLAVLREQAGARPPAPGLLAVVADPVYGAGDVRLAASPSLSAAGRQAPAADARNASDAGFYPRLVHSGQEAARILSLAPAAARFEAVGFDANLDLVLSGALGRYRIVHFATHGELDMQHPELSRLVLSLFDEAGRPRDGLLHAYEIYDLELAAELVVLSACQTALGPQLRGEGLVGLTRGFLHAGAERVLVSLWKVHDRTTAELMERFYRRLLNDGLSPPAALRAAQDSIRRQARWQEPYYWAGFVLQGEWRDLHR